MNAGQHRAMILINGRQVEGLHLCDTCAAVAMRAWPSDGSRQAVLLATTPWRGECDLCRFVRTLSGMLGGGDG